MISYRKHVVQCLTMFALVIPLSAHARDVVYGGNEASIYVRPGEPTQVNFPSKIDGGYKKKNSAVNLERQDNYLIVFAQQTLGLEGEAIIVHLDDKRSYSLRILPATGNVEKDNSVSIIDNRAPEVSEEDPQVNPNVPRNFAPPSSVSGLMREMILTAEFGKRKPIPGYRRSNRYTGETILSDGAIEAKIDEIFMGTDLWGYVLSVENQLETNQRINPATFRLDGTRAVVAERWELSARPLTEEQRIANAHRGRIYIITRAKRN